MSNKLGDSLFFYQGHRLVTAKQGDRHCIILRGNELPMAQLAASEGSHSAMLATDGKESILQAQSAEVHETLSFSVYGYGSTLPSSLTLLGFNGEFFGRPHSGYLLGNGHRNFNPVLMRFRSPDSLSPFLAGGLNAYAYCGNDPVNAVDPSGRVKILITRTIKRQPVNTVIKHGPENLVPIGATLVRDEGGSYFVKTWQPKPVIQKKLVRVVKLDGTQGRSNGYIPEENYKAYKNNRKQLNKLMSYPAPLTEADTIQLESLRNAQMPYLLEGDRLMKAATRDLGSSVTMEVLRVREESSAAHSDAQ